MPGPLILGPSVSSVASGVSLRVARRDIADQIGELAVVTVTTAASTSTSPDAARQMISLGLQADGLDPLRFDGFWAYVVDGDQAGEVRRVLGATYQGGWGDLLLDRPFSAPLAAGTEVELTDSLPAGGTSGGRWLSIKTINDIIVEACKRLPVEAVISLTGDGTRSLSLADYAFVESAEDVDMLRDRYPGLASTDPTERSPYNWEVRGDGATKTLITDLTYASGETVEVVVRRRAHTLVRVAGTWASSTTGPTNDSDEVAVPLHWLRTWGCGKAFEAMRSYAIREKARVARDRTLDRLEKAALLGALDERIGYCDERYGHWAGVAALLVEREFPRPSSRRTTPIVSGLYDDGGRSWP